MTPNLINECELVNIQILDVKNLDMSWLKLLEGQSRNGCFHPRTKARAEFMLNHFRIDIPNLKTKYGYKMKVKGGKIKLCKLYHRAKTTTKKSRKIKRKKKKYRAV